MKKTQAFFCSLTLFFCVCNFCFAQYIIKEDVIKDKKNNIQHTMFLELFGSANNLYNITYDCSFKLAEKHKLAVATGIGLLPFEINRYFDPYVSISLQVNYLIGRKNSHFEIGTGITNLLLFYQITYNYGNNREIEWGNYNMFGIPLRIGYRYQSDNGGVFWKFALVPTYYHNDYYYFPIHPFAGAAIGYTFKNKKE